MKIALVSSWGVECGVSSYCADLARGFLSLGHDVAIFSERWLAGATDDPRDLPEPNRCFLRAFLDPRSLAREILESKPDLVSIEHEFGIWPNDELFLALVNTLQHAVPVIVTLHTVPRRWSHRAFFRNLSVPVVVHHLGAVAMLDEFLKEVAYIPHGQSPFVQPPAARGGAVLMPGFVSPSKGHDEILEAMNYSDGWNLEIIGEGEGKYLSWLDVQIARYGLQGRVTVRPTFLPRDEMRTAMAHAGCVLLNSTSDNYSASGVAADCISVGAVTVSKAMPIYSSLFGLGFKFGYPAQPGSIPANEIGKAVETAIDWKHTPEQVAMMMMLCERRSWKNVAAERLQILGRFA